MALRFSKAFKVTFEREIVSEVIIIIIIIIINLIIIFTYLLV